MKTSTAVFVIAIVGSSLAVETPAQSKKKVLILGAGVAGITAAKTLHDKGIDDFLVLEGQDYIGGRMKNVPFAGLAVEEGANWIHYYDEEDNPMKALKNKHDLGGTTVNYDDSKMRLVNPGKRVTTKTLHKQLTSKAPTFESSILVSNFEIGWSSPRFATFANWSIKRFEHSDGKW